MLLYRYIKYLIKSKTKYDIHSPFVFNFIRDVLADKRHYYAFDEIDFIRQELLHDNTVLHVSDMGAGSKRLRSSERTVSQIAKNSLTDHKFGELLFRIAAYFNSTAVLELGTSLGISTLYFAKARPDAAVTTVEGSPEIATFARQVFTRSGAGNISLITGEFSHVLETNLVPGKNIFDLIYIDGNHKKEPTLAYFNTLLKGHSGPETVFIFDDIHWSREMEEAWQLIRGHEAVTCTIDLFFKGIVFIDHRFHSPHHFTLKY